MSPLVLLALSAHAAPPTIPGFNTIVRGHGAPIHLTTVPEALPAGYATEDVWFWLSAPHGESRQVWECWIGNHSVPSLDPACEGLPKVRALGYLYTEPGTGRYPLYRCMRDRGADHLVSRSESCEGYGSEGLLGYAVVEEEARRLAADVTFANRPVPLDITLIVPPPDEPYDPIQYVPRAPPPEPTPVTPRP